MASLFPKRFASILKIGKFIPVYLFLVVAVYACNPQIAESIRRKDLKKDVELMTELGPIVIRLSDETPKHRGNFVRLVNQHQLDSLNFYRVINSFLIQTGKDLPKEYPALIEAEFRPDLFHKRGAVNAAREGDETNPTQASANLHFTIIQGKMFTDSTLAKAEKRINNWLAYNKVITNPANAQLFLRLQTFSKEGANTDSLKAVQAKLEQLTQTKLQNMPRYRIPDEQRKVYKTIGGAPHLDQNYTVFGEVVKGMEIVDSIAGVKTDKTDKPLKDILILKARMIKRMK
jgi:cyclophilin family peptidyl-prolyl cis-trans isomerase